MMVNWGVIPNRLNRLCRLEGELVYIIRHSGDCHYSGYLVNEDTGLVIQSEKRWGYGGEFEPDKEYEKAHVEMRVLL